MSEYPEHDKIRALGSGNQTAGEFLDWLLQEKGYSLCEHREEERRDLEGGHVRVTPEGHYPIYTTTEKLLYEFFGIDFNKIEMEKRAMLQQMRDAHEAQEVEA